MSTSYTTVGKKLIKRFGADELKLKDKNQLLHPVNVDNKHWAFLNLNLIRFEGWYSDSDEKTYKFPMHLINK